MKGAAHRATGSRRLTKETVNTSTIREYRLHTSPSAIFVSNQTMSLASPTSLPGSNPPISAAMARKDTIPTPPQPPELQPRNDQIPQSTEQPAIVEPMQYAPPSKQESKGGTTFGLSGLDGLDESGFGEQPDMSNPNRKGKKKLGRVHWCWCCEQCYEHCCE
jgi:hypothetical protein